MTDVYRPQNPVAAQGPSAQTDCARSLGVVVHGMSRSGTSAVTGLFVASGYHAGGEADLMQANPGNPAGYYENINVYDVNEDVLAEMGASWFDPPSEATLVEARPRLHERLRRVFTGLLDQAAGAPLALKDPRIAVLMALWEPIIDYRLHPVLVVRDPVEVAQSLHARDGTPLALGLAAWELHMAILLRALNGATVTMAPYRIVLGSPEQARFIVEDANRHLQPERAARVRPSDGGGWLTEELAHNRAGSGDHDRFLTRRQAELWDWLSELPAGSVNLRPPAELLVENPAARSGVRAETARIRLARDHAETRQQLDQLAAHQVQTEARLAVANARINELTGEKTELIDSLEALERSTSWRATAILRRAGRLLRGGEDPGQRPSAT